MCQVRTTEVLIYFWQIEFGAGIHYNKSSSNPKSKDFKLGVGTFPDQTHAFDSNGWYYWEMMENGIIPMESKQLCQCIRPEPR